MARARARRAALLALLALAAAAAAAAAEPVATELAPARDAGLLRRVLFGGEAFATVCREKAEDAELRAEAFAEALRAQLGKKSQVRVLRAPCGEKFGASGNTLQKVAKLKREARGLPVIMWTAHGKPAKQIPAKAFTSPAPGAAKDGARQLDAAKLARSLERSEKTKAFSLKSNSALAKECLDLKYQICAVVLKHGGTERLASSKLSLLLGVARKHRFLRVFTVDTREFALALEGGGANVGLADESLVLLRRNEFVYSGPPELGPPRDSAAEAAQQRDKDAEAESLRAPHKVADTDKFPGGLALSLGLAAIGKAETTTQRMAAFRKHAIQSRAAARGLDPEERQAKLAFLFHSERGGDGYILDWPAARPLLLDRAAFGPPDGDASAALAALQLESLSRAKRGGPLAAAAVARGKSKRSKKSKGTYVSVHSPKLLMDSEGLVSAVRGFVRDPRAGTFAPYKDRPALSKVVVKKETSSKRPPSSKKSRPPSSSSKGSKSGVSDRDWERRRRQEMEEEARTSGAYAMPSDDLAGYDDDDDDDDGPVVSPFDDEDDEDAEDDEDDDDNDDDEEDDEAFGGEEIFLSDHDEL